MVRQKHNGEGFRYVITYRRADIPGAVNYTETVTDWHKSEITIKNQETYKEYEFSVQAINDYGPADSHVTKMRGFSGEDGKPSFSFTIIYCSNVHNIKT